MITFARWKWRRWRVALFRPHRDGWEIGIGLRYHRHQRETSRSAADFIPTPPPEVLDWAQEWIECVSEGERLPNLPPAAVARWIINTHEEDPT